MRLLVGNTEMQNEWKYTRRVLIFRSIFIAVLRWLNTVFDTSVSITFSSKTLYPLVAKIGTKQVNNINFKFLIIKLTYVPLPWQQD